MAPRKKNARAVTPLERLEGEPSTDIKGDLKRLLDETCKNKTAKDLETDEAVIQGLRKVLLSWRDAQSEDQPQKLVYLLETAHDRKKLRLGALDKDDAKKASLLDVHARKYGFHIGLGEVVFHEEGYGLRMGGPRGRNRGGRFGGRFGGYYRGCVGYGGMDSDSEMGSESEGGWDDPYSRAGGDEVEMEEVHETKLTLENLVDLEGTMLADTVELTATAEVVHEDMQKKLKTRGHTKQKYSASRCSTLERWYRGRALLIWPKRHHFDILYGATALDHACYALKKATSAQPTREAQDLVDMILSRVGAAKNWIASIYLCDAAVLWGDVDLWVRAVRACKVDDAIAELRPDNIFAAIGAFGFDAIQECVEHALEQDTQPLMTLLFLKNLEAKADGEDGAAFAFAEEWAPEWRLKIVSAIKNPAVHEAGTIVAASMKAGGAKILEKTVIPTLKATTSPAFMLALAEQVHATDDITPGVKKRIVKDALVSALAQAKLYDTMDDAETLKFAEAALKACLQTGNEPSAADLAKRLVDLSGLDDAAVRKRFTGVLLPLAGAVTKLVGEQPSTKALAAVNPICDTAIAQFWQGLSVPDTTVNSKDVKTFLDTARMGSVAVSDIIRKLLTLDLKSPILEIFINELSSRRSAGTLAGIDDALPLLVQKFATIASIDISSLMFYKFRFQPPVVQSFACCIRAGVPAAAATILARVQQQHPAKTDDVALVVSLLAARLPRWLAELKPAPAPTDPAYAALFRRLYTFWVDTLMGPLRATPGLDAAVAALEKRIAEWEKECDCGPCESIRGVLQGWRAEYEFEEISAKVRSHMKRGMNQYFDKQVHAKNSSYGHGFKVTKYAELLASSRWRTWKAEGNEFLGDLAATMSEEDIKVIFGNNYARIMQTLRGTAAPANALKRPAESAPVVSGSGSTAPPAAKRRKV